MPPSPASQPERHDACQQELASARAEVRRQAGELGLEDLRWDGPLASCVRELTLARELDALLRQELEVENLLRTTLEWLLRRVGSMNAAIYLPGSTGDFTLGAFVNFDRPREKALPMLEELCHAVVPAFENSRGLQILPGVDALDNLSTPACESLRGCTFAVYSCRSKGSAGECLAVLTLFRDEREFLTRTPKRHLEMLGILFSRQLARCVHTSTRHQSSTWRDVLEDGGAAA